MNIVTVPGWELAHFHHEQEHLQMVWSPLFEENMGLDCWCLNIFPPKGHVFWHFGKYRGFSLGEHHFGQSLANDKVKHALDTLLFEYFDDREQGILYLSGLTQFFGDTFPPVEHGHISVVAPPKLRDDCETTARTFSCKCTRTLARSPPWPSPAKSPICPSSCH